MPAEKTAPTAPKFEDKPCPHCGGKVPKDLAPSDQKCRNHVRG